MIYFLPFESEKGKVGIIILDKEGEKEFTCIDLLSNPERLIGLRDEGILTYVDSSPKFKMPFPTFTNLDEVAQNKQGLNVGPLFKVFLQHSLDKLNDAHYQALLKQLPQTQYFTLDILKKLHITIIQTQQFLEGKLLIKIEAPQNILANPMRTRELIDSVNSQIIAPSYETNGTNLTHKMRKADDIISISIPSWDNIKIDDYDFMELRKTNVMPEYDNPDYRKPEILERRDIKDKKIIVGDADNNDLTIQPNEMDYYNRLKELIDFAIKEDGATPDSPDVREGTNFKMAYDYIKTLIESITSWNWSHSGAVPIGYMGEMPEDIDAERDEESVSDGMNGAQIFLTMDAKEGLALLERFIEKATENNLYASAEAVIKLLRWGIRKPSKLKLDGYDKYLNLTKFMFENSSGSLKDLNIVPVRGYNQIPLALIIAGGNIKDVRYVRNKGFRNPSLNIPVGIVCERTFSDGQKQRICYTLTDFIDYLKTKESNEVEDIKVNSDGSITCTKVFDIEESVMLGDIVHLVTNDSTDTYVYYHNESFKDLFVSYQLPFTGKSELSILDIFMNDKNANNTITEASFKNEEELEFNILEKNLTPLECCEAKIADKILSTTLRVANGAFTLQDNGNSLSSQDYFNLYNADIVKNRISSESKSTVGQTKQEELKNNILSKMNNFQPQSVNTVNEVKQQPVMESASNITNSSNESSEEEYYKMLQSKLLKPVPDGSTAYLLTGKVKSNPNDNNSPLKVVLIGYAVAMKESTGTSFVLLAPTHKNRLKMGAQVPIFTIFKRLPKLMFDILQGKPELGSVQFNDMESLKHFAINSMNIVE